MRAGLARGGAVFAMVPALAMGPVAVLASTQMTLVLGLAAICALAVLIGRGQDFRLGWPGWPRLVLLALFLAYVAAGDLWTPMAPEGVDRAFRLAIALGLAILVAMALPGLNAPERARLARAWLVGLALAVLLLLAEAWSGNAILGALTGDDLSEWLPAHNRASGVLALMLPVALAGLIRAGHRVWAGLVALGLIGLIASGPSEGALLAALCGAVASFLGWVRPRLTAGLILAGLAALALVLPELPRRTSVMAPLVEAASDMGFSVQHRLVVLHFSAERIAERPWLGWGARASRELPGADRTVAEHAASLPEPWPVLAVTPSAALERVMPLHPHNAVIEARLELGLIGTGLLLLALGACICPRRQPGPAVAAALGVTSAAATLWMTSYGLWQSWLIAAVLLALIGAALASAIVTRPDAGGRRGHPD